jgi:hypothetical protein
VLRRTPRLRQKLHERRHLILDTGGIGLDVSSLHRTPCEIRHLRPYPWIATVMQGSTDRCETVSTDREAACGNQLCQI